MKNIYEVFDEYEKAETVDDKITVLRNNSSYALRNILQGTFDKNIKFNIKEIPPYKKSDAPPGLGYSSIHQELSRVYLFQENNPKASAYLSENRRKQILIQILECLEAREAEIYANMILKKQNVKGLTPMMVRSAFPDLLSK